jgi:hypothetical protein
MKRNTIAILFFLVSLIATSCSKIDALFSNGELTTESRELNHRFTAISMYNNVNVKLVHDSHPHMELRCPKNLIEKVTTEIDGDTLYIKNENEYNWLRSYDYSIDLTVYYDSLRQINFASVGDLRCSDSIKGIPEMSIDTIGMSINTTETGIDTTWNIQTDWIRNFNLNINEGCGDIDLTLNCDVVKTNFGNGTSKVTLSGVAEYTEIIMRSYGVVHAENLNSNFVRVQSHSTNDAYVWARTKLTVWLYSIGNVYYRGNLEPIVLACTSDGQVIPLRP